MARPVNVERLQRDIAWAIARGLGPSDLVPMLRRLIRHAAPGSECRLLAQQQLAELIVASNPWSAVSLAREVLRSRDDDRLWGILGLGHTLLGNHQCARRAYQQALVRAPGCASYAHNLGHLLDVAFDRPGDALPWLRRAYRLMPTEREVAASFAHALLRCGLAAEAAEVLEGALGSAESAQALLEKWSERHAKVTAPPKVCSIGTGTAGNSGSALG
jgi:Flp pilus assembly protein TadD